MGPGDEAKREESDREREKERNYVTYLTLSFASLRVFDASSTVPPTMEASLISTNMSPACILGKEEKVQ